ncbi:MAG: hypothetical protein Q4E76_02985 [Tissierellia bacterium]|nr:hypothetical protein [Tissierellia bacterium]
MAIQCVIRSTLRLPKAKVIEVLDESGQVILSTSQNLITDGIDSIFRDFTFVPFTLSLKDADGNIRFTIHKKRSNPMSATNFTLIFRGGRILIHEGSSFRMPNLVFSYHGRELAITGRVRDSFFQLEENGYVLATYDGEGIDDGIDYFVNIIEETLPLEIFLAVGIVLDNLYHAY